MDTPQKIAIEYVPMDRLKLASYNPRTLSQHQFESLQRSIDQHGFIDPIIANKRTMTICGGHQRLRAAQALGYTEVPVVWVDINEEQERSLNIGLNKIGGEFDNDMLAELLAGMDEELVALTGFTDEEIEKLQDAPDMEDIKDDKPKRYTTKELRDLIKSYHPQETEPLERFIDWLERV